MDDRITTFAHRLKELKELKGLTNADIAKAIGKSRSNIGRYLSGEYEGKQDVVFALHNKYGVAVEWLMGFDAPMYGDDDDIDDRLTPAGRILFQTLRGATEEEIEQATRIIEALRR